MTLLLLAAVVLSPTAVTVYAASSASPPARATSASPLATTHPIQYAIAGPPSMVDDSSSLTYFKAYGFSTVELVVPDNQTYQKELNTIKALGMQPVIDVEMVIWNGGQLVSTPITSFHAYFQSLKNAGWEYVASEGGRSGDPSYIKSLGLSYINYNCDQCGLWEDIYKDNGTVLNSWESYDTAEWPFIQNGSTQAAALGIQNGILAGLWENVNSDNQIYANSLPGSSTTPSYLSMLNWSYSNGVGFNQFCVWCGNDTTALQDYENLEFPQIVANLQNDYPAITALNATVATATVNVNQNFIINGSLRTDTTGIAGANITLQRSVDNVTWNNVTTTATYATGNYQFSKNESAAGTYYYRTAYDGNATYANATSNVVNVQIKITPASSPAVTDGLYLFVRGSDNALWYNYWTGTTWTAATSLGGNLTSAPAATSPGTSAIDVFVQGTNGAVYEKTTTNNGATWSGWASLGGVLAAGSSPAATSPGSGQVDISVLGTGNVLWWKTTTSSWRPVGDI